jgi:SLOG cluster3 family
MSAPAGRPIFLSASVPLPARNPAYFNTADIVAIRDAVRALTIVIMEANIQLVFGGHPAISPMIRLQIAQAGLPVGNKVVMFQSSFFKRVFPNDNKAFERVVVTDAVDEDREKSLARMRDEMLRGPFLCGIFIGGMEGVEEEYNLFRKAQPGVAAFPVASTGAAAAILYQSDPDLQENIPQLQTEISYINLMRNLISSSINQLSPHGPTHVL